MCITCWLVIRNRTGAKVFTNVYVKPLIDILAEYLQKYLIVQRLRFGYLVKENVPFFKSKQIITFIYVVTFIVVLNWPNLPEPWWKHLSSSTRSPIPGLKTLQQCHKKTRRLHDVTTLNMITCERHSKKICRGNTIRLSITCTLRLNSDVHIG